MIFFVNSKVQVRDRGALTETFLCTETQMLLFGRQIVLGKTTPPGFLPRGLFYDGILLNSSEEIIHGTIEVICDFNKVIQRGVALPRQPVIENAPGNLCPLHKKILAGLRFQ